MNKCYLALLSLLLLLPSVSQAQSGPSIRTLAIEQLSQYGKTIYDRGDYSEAAVVFSRILAMDPQNQEAIFYANNLNKKGETVVIPVVSALPPADSGVKAVSSVQTSSTLTTITTGVTTASSVVSDIPIPVKNTSYRHEIRDTLSSSDDTFQHKVDSVIAPTSEISEPMVSGTGNKDLKQGIQEADDAIAKLKTDVNDLREQIAKGQKDLAISK
ncbi:MAG: hypothetical protein HQL15_04895 [Candidatus Omnitrophica bacterium]|nr:hypothetical protein [Candidatus Omnitrophota bacterium]